MVLWMILECLVLVAVFGLRSGKSVSNKISTKSRCWKPVYPIIFHPESTSISISLTNCWYASGVVFNIKLGSKGRNLTAATLTLADTWAP